MQIRVEEEILVVVSGIPSFRYKERAAWHNVTQIVGQSRTLRCFFLCNVC